MFCRHATEPYSNLFLQIHFKLNKYYSFNAFLSKNIHASDISTLSTTCLYLMLLCFQETLHIARKNTIFAGWFRDERTYNTKTINSHRSSWNFISYFWSLYSRLLFEDVRPEKACYLSDSRKFITWNIPGRWLMRRP